MGTKARPSGGRITDGFVLSAFCRMVNCRDPPQISQVFAPVLRSSATGTD
jgi:hypothetical protein